MWSENEVEFMSTLYLPRNSPVYWPIQVSQKRFFSVLWATVWSRNKVGAGPPGPLLWIRDWLVDLY